MRATPTPTTPAGAAATVVAAALLGWAVAGAPVVAAAPRLSLAVAAVALAVGTAARIDVRVGATLVRCSPWAAAATLAAVSTHPGQAVAVAGVVGAAVTAGVHRSGPLAAARAGAATAAGVGAAALVAAAAPSPDDLAHFGGWAVVAATTTAAQVAAWLPAAAATRRRDGERLPLLAAAPAVVAGWLVTVGVAVLAIGAATAGPWVLALLGVGTAAAVAADRAHRGLLARYADLEALYDLTQRLAARSEEHDVLREVLVGLQQALACGRSQLLVVRPSSTLHYELDADGAVTVQETAAPPALAGLLVEGKDAILARRGARHHLGDVLAASGFDDAIVVRLPGDPDDPPRMLVVADRRQGTFGTRDLPFLQTLAAQCAVSLRGTRLLDELRSEVASREHDALHDSLTRLGNRALFSRSCEQALARQRPGASVVVMLMDLDGFKEINDTLGHHVGDLVLQEVARRLHHEVGHRGTATRLGGDEFAIVYPTVPAKADVRAVAQAIADAVRRPMEVGELALDVQASIGIALAPGHGSDSPTLLKCADVAMYAAKGSSEHISVYQPGGDQHSTRRLMLASELRRAVEAGGLALHYQPKADLRTGAVIGFEALLRWPHPNFGDVSPVEFIPIAEQAGLIDGMTWWVLAEALRQQRAWAAAGHDVSVAVNISARSLLDGGLATRLGRLLAGSGVRPERLVLEVTETSVMSDTERAGAVLHAAAALGVRISVDDFGTGYSSLSRLLEMPVHEIKVDRSFVTTMLHSGDNLAIVQSTINLALSMGRQVTAEGVEDDATWVALRELGCHLAQGYVLARPMPGERTVGWLSEHAMALAGARMAAGTPADAVPVAGQVGS